MAYSSAAYTSWACGLLWRLLVLGLLASLATGSRILPLSEQNITLRRGTSRPSSMTITGTVFCDQCIQQRFTKHSAILHGASIVIECKPVKSTGGTVRAEILTDEHGMFKAVIALSPRRVRQCIVRLVSSPIKSCSAQPSNPSTFTSASLKSKQGRRYFYNAGFLSYRPDSPPPSFCHEKALPIPAANNSSGPDTTESKLPLPFLPPIPIISPAPIVPGLPSVPFLPPIPIVSPAPVVPGLPSVPFLPPIPVVSPAPVVPGLPPLPLVPSLPSLLPSLPPLTLPPIPLLTPPPVPAMPKIPLVPSLPLPPLPFISPAPVTPSLPPIPIFTPPPFLPGLPPIPGVPILPLSARQSSGPNP